ncbi:hypothetical protein EJ110_NYTH09096, partial [Nymphaea thermarum]
PRADPQQGVFQRLLGSGVQATQTNWLAFGLFSVAEFMISDGGGAPYAIDVANGHLVCGCGDINYRKVHLSQKI